jgi:hypothetical protein
MRKDLPQKREAAARSRSRKETRNHTAQKIDLKERMPIL